MIGALRRHPLAWMLPAFIALAVVFVWATPPMEASDEYPHFGMVETIWRTGALPVQQPTVEDTLYRQQASQPPLYYRLAALIVSPFDLDDADGLRVINPHARYGEPDSHYNKNAVLHDGAQAEAPQARLALYVLRLFSIVLGAVTVTCVYAVGRFIAPERRAVAILAAGLVAFNPMFLFISASVNNDNLVTALTSAGVVLALLTLRDGFNTRRSILLAVVIALATLSKLSGLVLVPTVAAAGLWVGYRDRDLRGLALLGVSMIIAWGGLAGWWYARNLTLYGELFGTHTMVAVAGARPTAFTVDTALAEFEGFRWSFWGVFGLFNIVVPTGLFYVLLDALVLFGGVGLVFVLADLVRRRRDPAARDRLGLLVFLFGVLAVGTVAFLNWTAQTYASQGRLIFPYNAATLPLVALGLVSLAARLRLPAQGRPALLVLPPLAIAALTIPLTVIAPQYRVLQPIAALPETASPAYVRWGDVELLGYHLPDGRYAPGDRVPVTLYWRPLAQSREAYSVFLILFDPDGREIGKVDSYPGAGSLRTSSWQVGALYADRYEIPIYDDVEGMEPLRLQIGWWEYASGERLPPVDAAGNGLGAVVVDAGVLAAPGNPVVAAVMGDDVVRVEQPSFGDMIRLDGYHLDRDRLTLHWQALAAPGRDYTVFVQMVNANGEIVGQGDAPPAFPTRHWQAGERHVSTHQIRFTQPVHGERLTLLVGWYAPDSFARLYVNAPGSAYRLLAIAVPDGLTPQR
ncbi:MAG: glycosyltransferase family 39 protein [Chloroflexota bacterium]